MFVTGDFVKHITVLAFISASFLLFAKQATADEALEKDASTFVSELVEELAPDEQPDPVIPTSMTSAWPDSVARRNKSLAGRPGHKYSAEDHEKALRELQATLQTIFIVIIVVLVCYCGALVYTQYIITRDVNRLRRVVENRLPALPHDVENPREEPGRQPERRERSRSDTPAVTPTTETEEQQEEEARPSRVGQCNPRNPNPSGDRPDEYTGKTLVSEVREPIGHKEHDDPDSENIGRDSGDTCQVDKGKLEKVGDPQQAREPSSRSSGASGEKKPDYSSSTLSPGDAAARRASNGSPSPRKESATPSPTKPKEIAPGVSKFEIIG